MMGKSELSLCCTSCYWFYLIIEHFVIVKSGDVQQQQSYGNCDPKLDIFFMADSSDPQAFFKCNTLNNGGGYYWNSVGAGAAGQWERHFCPNDMHFAFKSQDCRTNELPPNVIRGDNNLVQVAILNGSCANNEVCLGGTVCDPMRHLCLCPYGKTTNLEMLACTEVPAVLTSASYLPVQSQQPQQQTVQTFAPQNYPSATYQAIPYTQTYSGGAISSSPQYSPYSPYTPIQSFPIILPSTTPSTSSPSPNVQYFVKTLLQRLGLSPSDAQSRQRIAEYQQRLQKLLYLLYKNYFRGDARNSTNEVVQQYETFASPGMGCKNGERCTGGSVCVRSVGTCLCPDNLENYGGHCTNPMQLQLLPSSETQPHKGEVAETSSNQWRPMTMAKTQEPLAVGNQFQIVRTPKERRESGPGELCNDGQTCVRGSLCNRLIPICVCPPGTDLINGWCLTQSSPKSSQNNGEPSLNSITDHSFGKPREDESTDDSGEEQRELPPASGKNVYVSGDNDGSYRQKLIPISSQEPDSAAKQKQIYLSGSSFKKSTSGYGEDLLQKQLQQAANGLVGAQCSINTDCTQGAYCNGNTHPTNCQCLSTHVNINGRCQKVILPGQVGCDNDLQCSAGYAGTRCVSRQCHCPNGLRAIEQSCISDDEREGIPPGSSCSNMMEPCGGGSSCRNGLCTCAEGFMPSDQGICMLKEQRPNDTVQQGNEVIQPLKQHSYQLQMPAETKDEKKTNKPMVIPMHTTTMAPPITTTQKLCAPSTQCGPLDVCIGGSSCVDGWCLCPAGTRPSSKTGNCETFVQKIAAEWMPTTVNNSKSVDLQHQQVPTPPTPIKRRYARPSESCESSEICTGGSYCENKKVCVCPALKPIVREHICIPSDQKPMIQSRPANPGERCDDMETKCTQRSICHEGICRCQPGSTLKDGHCIESPILTSNNTKITERQSESKVSVKSDSTTVAKKDPKRPNSTAAAETLSDDPLTNWQDDVAETEVMSSSNGMHKLNRQKPLVTGPPLRKISEVSSNSASAGASGSGASGKGPLVLGEGPGICPRGNTPLMDSGKLVVCNGMQPNCPPRSYCFVTGAASESYNCCKTY